METRILIVIGALFALGALVIAAIGRPGRTDDGAAGRLWQLYALQVGIVSVILVPAYLGGGWWLAALLVLGLRAQHEFLELHGASVAAPRYLAAQVLAAGVILAAGLAGAATAAVIAAFALVAHMAVALVKLPEQRPTWQVSAYSVLFPITPFAHLALFDRLAEGFAWLAFLYIVVEVNDSFAYLAGRSFGKRRLLPRLSPNKTVLGLVSGLAAALLAGLALNAHVFALRWDLAVGAVLVIIAGGLAGDLATSALKRRAGRKDFAVVLKAHGGVLDIYDSLLVAAPFFLAYRHWLHA